MDRAQALRLLRGLLMICLAWELLCTLPYPSQSPAQFRETVQPAWRHSLDEDFDPEFEDAPVCAVYMSSLLLQRCHAAMAYNTSSQQFETPPLPLWRSTEDLLSSNPAAGWATWQELVMTAKHPWAAYWASQVVPDSWHVMPLVMRENLELLAAAVPVVAPPDPPPPPPAAATTAQPSSAAAADDEQEQDDVDDPSVSFWVARCVSDVNATTLRPIAQAHCTVLVRGREAHSGGTFLIQPGPPPPSAAAAAALGSGPAARSLLWLLALVRRWRWLARLLQLLGRAAPLAVPTLTLIPLGGLLQQLAVLELEFGLKVAVLYVVVLLVALRNWLFLLSIVYKIAARLALLAFHNPWQRLSGTVLTFIGFVLGLWQSVGFGVLDICLDAVMARGVLLCLGQSGTVAWLVWQCSMFGGVFEGRLALKAWALAKQTWGDVRHHVINPRALLNQQAVGVTAPLRQQVTTVGSWPAPLDIPEVVDDLSNAEVPRGFICPITQSIMRQPALLLHDDTIAPSTYDKEAITQWLAEHSSDPKNPGTQLRMKSVRLVYNGDLARAIEDWVKDKQTDKAQSDQLRYIQQRLLALRTQAQARIAARQQDATAAAAAADEGEGAAPVGDAGVVAAAAAAVGAAGPAGAVAAAALVAETGQLVRQPSATLAAVASMDLPQVAAAGLASLTSATRRMTTRAAARRLREQQLREEQQQGQDQQDWQQQQQQLGRQRRRRRGQQAGFVSSDGELGFDSEGDGGGGEGGGDHEQDEGSHEREAASGRRNGGASARGSSDRDGDGGDDDAAGSGSQHTPGGQTQLRLRRSQRATTSARAAAG